MSVIILVMYDTFIQFLDHLLGQPLSRAAQAEIEKSFKPISLPKNAKLLEQGKICKHCYYIHKGCCRFYHTNNQHEYTHWFSFEQEIATSLSSFTAQKPSFESIELLEDSHLLSIEYERLNHLYNDYHEWDHIGRIMLEELTARFEFRIMSYYSFTAKEKCTFLLEHEPQIIQRVPMKYISSYLGIKQESLSRIRANIR